VKPALTLAADSAVGKALRVHAEIFMIYEFCE
jgi:hypothetical protein